MRSFTLSMVRNRGNVSEVDLNAFYAAGYGEQQVLDIILDYLKMISNYTNHIAKTPVDAAFQICLVKKIIHHLIDL
jgi:hypothetical protein